jgi:hypothetical protein
MARHPAHAQNKQHPDEPRSDEIGSALKGATFRERKNCLHSTI